MMKKITNCCTGCRACEQICASHAIIMTANSEGFIESNIIEENCVNCGLCAKICPQNNKVESNMPIKVYGARLKNDEVLARSASGGAFAGMATAVIDKGGVVYGVSYTTEWNAAHIRIDTLEQISSLQSSKYVQADTLNTFKEVKSDLLKNKIVLFCGTGCQIGGLKAYLRKDYENLLTMDLICHGVTSPLMFKKYIEWIERKENNVLNYYNFRDKTLGWGLFYRYVAHKKKRVESCEYDPYYRCFLSGDAYHECCYNCKYSHQERVSDFTVGDFWGIQNQHPDFFSLKGVSAILINTKKGIDFFELVKHLFFYIESEFDKVANENTNLLRPTSRNNNRDGVYIGIEEPNWFNELAKKYRPSFKQKVKRLVPLKFKIIIKSFFNY